MPAPFDTVRKIAMAFDGVEEGTSYGTPAFKVSGNLIARLKEDGETLVVRMEFEQRAALIETDPETYFLTDHYLNYEWILVRLARVSPDALRDLLRGAWRAAAASKKRKVNSRKKPRKA